MADAQPVICQFLKLPPDQETIFRIKEIPTIFVEKLDHLHLALAVYQDSHSCPPQIAQVLKGLRKAAADQCEPLFSVVYGAIKFAGLFLQLLDALDTTSVKASTLELIQSVSRKAGNIAKKNNTAHESMGTFSRNISAAVHEMTTILDNDGHTAGDSLFTTENSQAVADLLHAVDECRSLLQKNARYYAEMNQHLQDIESIKSTPPTLQEVGMVRQRWIEFSKSIDDLTRGFGYIRGQIRDGSTVHRIDNVPERWRTLAQSTSQAAPSAQTRPQLKAITGPPEATTVASSTVPASTADKPLKRSRAHRILSYISTTWKRIFRL